MRIFVGNLSYQTGDADLEAAFRSYGDVGTATVVMDRDSGRSKGFAFVEMADQSQAMSAINGLNGKDLDGRPLTVNEAKPREDRPRNDRRW
ncbi:MAG: RNA-binding protein [Dehalococcoidia bacterium]